MSLPLRIKVVHNTCTTPRTYLQRAPVVPFPRGVLQPSAPTFTLPTIGAFACVPGRPRTSISVSAVGPFRVKDNSTLTARVAPIAAASTSAAGAAAGAEAATPAATRDDFAIDQRPIILFDGVCNLCNGGVNFMLDNDPEGIFRLAALQSPAGRRLLLRCGRSPDDISSIVLVEQHRHFIRSEAILRIGAALRLPLPLLSALGFPVPLPLRDAFYDAVAKNRYSFFGSTDACRMGDGGKFADRFIVN